MAARNLAAVLQPLCFVPASGHFVMHHGEGDLSVAWIAIDDPDDYVKTRLAEEADDIPDAVIAAGSWYPDRIDIREIRVDRPLIARHDREPRHIARRDAFIAAMDFFR